MSTNICWYTWLQLRKFMYTVYCIYIYIYIHMVYTVFLYSSFMALQLSSHFGLWGSRMVWDSTSLAFCSRNFSSVLMECCLACSSTWFTSTQVACTEWNKWNNNKKNHVLHSSFTLLHASLFFSCSCMTWTYSCQIGRNERITVPAPKHHAQRPRSFATWLPAILRSMPCFTERMAPKHDATGCNSLGHLANRLVVQLVSCAHLERIGLEWHRRHHQKGWTK